MITGGTVIGDKGCFVKPTLIHDIDQRAPVVQEKIFGPVLVASAVDDLDDLDELAALANDSIYGLSASVWTRDISSAYKLAKKIRAGTITISSGSVAGPNIPFGGFKQSGWGRENGVDGIESFAELKTVITALQAEPIREQFFAMRKTRDCVVPAVRLELTTYRLQGGCSTN